MLQNPALQGRFDAQSAEAKTRSGNSSEALGLLVQIAPCLVLALVQLWRGWNWAERTSDSRDAFCCGQVLDGLPQGLGGGRRQRPLGIVIKLGGHLCGRERSFGTPSVHQDLFHQMLADRRYDGQNGRCLVGKYSIAAC